MVDVILIAVVVVLPSLVVGAVAWYEIRRTT